MIIKQFEYKSLAHYSYALISKQKMVVIDPERNPEQYLEFAKAHDAKIVAIIETHSHADFVSSHLEIHKKTNATIYCSKYLNANYPHHPFDDGDSITINDFNLKAINTPGHSADSITIVATNNKKTILFTGDTLLIGDVGRPDLRGTGDNMDAKRQELAEKMYHTMQNKFSDLPDNAVVYPAHGAGSLCGKSMSDDSTSTLGEERENNWAFKDQSQEEFIESLLEDQSMIPPYFKYDVEVNKTGASLLHPSIDKISFKKEARASGLIVDIRDEAVFKANHLKGSFNIQGITEEAPFETWLGVIIKPIEEFTLVIDKPENKYKLLHRVAKIGYEKQVKQVITIADDNKLENMKKLDLEDFRNNPDNYTIVDVRNKSEVDEEKFFEEALEHPLNKLRDTAAEIPTNKPIVVHCASGYRSAIGSSVLHKKLDQATVFDLSDDIEKFK